MSDQPGLAAEAVLRATFRVHVGVAVDNDEATVGTKSGQIANGFHGFVAGTCLSTSTEFGTASGPDNSKPRTSSGVCTTAAEPVPGRRTLTQPSMVGVYSRGEAAIDPRGYSFEAVLSRAASRSMTSPSRVRNPTITSTGGRAPPPKRNAPKPPGEAAVENDYKVLARNLIQGVR